MVQDRVLAMDLQLLLHVRCDLPGRRRRHGVRGLAAHRSAVRAAPAVAAGAARRSLRRAGLAGRTTTPAPLAKTLRSFVPKSPKEMGRIERMMAGAGYHGPVAGDRCSRLVADDPADRRRSLLVDLRFGTGDEPLVVRRSWRRRSATSCPTLWLGRAIEAPAQADPERPARRHRPADRLHRVGLGHRPGAQPRRRGAGARLSRRWRANWS